MQGTTNLNILFLTDIPHVLYWNFETGLW